MRLTGLVVHPGARPRLTGQLTVTSDVSEVLALEVSADFYDGRGHIVGSGTQVLRGSSVGHGHEDGHRGPDEAVDIEITPEAPYPHRAVAAVVTVPQLVNE